MQARKQSWITSAVAWVLMVVAFTAICYGYTAPESSVEQQQARVTYTCSTYTKDHLTSYECDKN